MPAAPALLVAASHSPHQHALVALLLLKGLRVSEALALDVNDYDRVARWHRMGGRAARAVLPRHASARPPSTPVLASALLGAGEQLPNVTRPLPDQAATFAISATGPLAWPP